MKTSITIFLLFIILSASAQKNSTQQIEYQIINKLRLLQAQDEGPFVKGGFGSFREYRLKPGRFKRDRNVFFTALVLMTLRELYPALSEPSRKVADSIIADAIPSFKRFKNQKGRPTFNFWSTNPPEIFPEGGFLNLYNESRALPDDMDCTSISLMALNEDDSIAEQVHRIMQDFVNDGKKKSMPAVMPLGSRPVYSTWFGKKMAVEFDASVLCNVETMVHQYRLPLTAADSATLQYLADIIEHDHHLKDPLKTSPNYATPAIILYHYSRLMKSGQISALENFREKMARQADSLYRLSDNLVEKMMLSTALLRWGRMAPKDTISIKSSLVSAIMESRFVFFIANLGTGFPDGWKHELASGLPGRFNYYCPAYDLVLALENLIESRKQND